MIRAKAALVLALTGVLAACESPITNASGPTGPELPPLGLASTAVWLEQREALTTQGAQRAAEIQAAQRTEAFRTTPGAQPVSSQGAVTVPERATPASQIGRAAQAFADICAASLPNMAGVAERMRQVNVRDFGVAPSESNTRRTGAFLIGGQPQGDIYINVGVDVGRENVNQCAVSVRRQDASATAQALINTVAAQGYALTPTTADNAQRAWVIEGAPAGTQLKMNSRRNALGQIVTGVWITWP